MRVSAIKALRFHCRSPILEWAVLAPGHAFREGGQSPQPLHRPFLTRVSGGEECEGVDASGSSGAAREACAGCGADRADDGGDDEEEDRRRRGRGAVLRSSSSDEGRSRDRDNRGSTSGFSRLFVGTMGAQRGRESERKEVS